MANHRPSFGYKCITMIMVTIVARWLYDPSFECDFTFDDHLAVLNNADVDTTRTPAKNLWQNDIWGKNLKKIDSHKSWRPLLMFSFRLSHAAQNGFNSRAFHFLGVWIHAIVSGLMVFLADSVLQGSLEVSFLVALTFAVHPVHVEGVTSIVNRAEPLCALFVILSRFAYGKLASVIWFRDTNLNQQGTLLNDGSGGSKSSTQPPSLLWIVNSLKTIFWAVMVTVLFMFAVMSKETGLTMVAILATYDALRDVTSLNKYNEDGNYDDGNKEVSKENNISSVGSGTVSGGGASSKEKDALPKQKEVATSKNGNEVDLKSKKGRHLLFNHWMLTGMRVSLLFLLTFGYLLVRLHMMTEGGIFNQSWMIDTSKLDFSSMSLDHSGLIRKAENPFALLEEGSLASILSIGYLHFRYVWLLVFPRTLSAEYSYNCIPSVDSLFDPRNGLTLSAYVSLFSLIFYGLQHPRKHKSLLESLAWGVFPFVPASCIFTKVGTLLAERLLYLPSVGYCLLLGWLLVFLEQNHRFMIESLKKLTRVKSSITKLQHQTQASSTSIGGGNHRNLIVRSFWWLMLAMMFARTRYRISDWKDDWTLFHAALQTCPNSAKTNNQIGQLWMNKKNPERALLHYKKAAEIDPDFCDVDYTQALAYANMGQLDLAKTLLKKSLTCVFTSNGAFTNLQLIWKHQLENGGQKDPFLLEDIGNTLLLIVKGAEEQEKEAEQKLVETQKRKEKKWSYKLYKQVAFLINKVRMFSETSSSFATSHDKKATNNQMKKKQAIINDDSVSIPLTSTTMETAKYSPHSSHMEGGGGGGKQSNNVYANKGKENTLAINSCEHLQAAGVRHFEARNLKESQRLLEKVISIGETYGFERCESRYWLGRTLLSVVSPNAGGQFKELETGKFAPPLHNQVLSPMQKREVVRQGLKHIEVAVSPVCPLTVSKPSIEIRTLLYEVLDNL